MGIREESQPLRGGQLKASMAARPWTLGTRGQAGAPVTSDSHGESQLVTCLIKPGPPEEPVLQVGLRPGQGWRHLSPGHVASYSRFVFKHIHTSYSPGCLPRAHMHASLRGRENPSGTFIFEGVSGWQGPQVSHRGTHTLAAKDPHR